MKKLSKASYTHIKNCTPAMKLLHTYFIIAAASILLFLISCNKKFDVPPVGADPDVAPTITIMQLKERYLATGVFQRIQDDQIISGIVTADDRSGSFYQQIIIQDETSGIPVLLEGANTYTQYPVGRRVLIKLKGMMLGDYGGTIQVGLDSARSDDGRFLNLIGIPQAQFDEYIIKGSFGNTVVPKVVKPSDFTKNGKDPLLSTLIQIENAEFREADFGKTYGDATKKVSALNYTIRTCESQSILLRNSSYARFAGIKIPEGNGPLIAIAAIFNGTVQLTIRDTADVPLTGTRCASQPPVPKTIAEIRQMYQGANSSLQKYTVGGTVISDAASKNIPYGVVVLQSGNRGIMVYMGGNITYNMGDSIVLNLTQDDSLINYQNSLEIKMNRDFVKPVPVASGKNMIPVLKTISELNATLSLPLGDAGNFGHTLIKIADAAAPTGVFSGSKTLTDATGSITMYTQPASTFASLLLPKGNQSWVGYVSNFNTTKQFAVRNIDDVTGINTLGFGAFAAAFDFSGVTTSSGNADTTTAPIIPGLSFTNFTAVGVGNNSSATGRFSFSTWPVGAQTGSDDFKAGIDLNKYYELVITPVNGAALDLSKMSFRFQRSGLGVRQASVRSSIDNFAANITAVVEPGNSNLLIVADNIIQIADDVTIGQDGAVIMFTGDAYKNITQPVRLRFYGYNSKSNGGTFSIDNVNIEGLTHD